MAKPRQPKRNIEDLITAAEAHLALLKERLAKRNQAKKKQYSDPAAAKLLLKSRKELSVALQTLATNGITNGADVLTNKVAALDESLLALEV